MTITKRCPVVEECDGYECSLPFGHRGDHKSYIDHHTDDSDALLARWSSRPTASIRSVLYTEVDEWDLLPDATEEERMTLPTIEQLR